MYIYIYSSSLHKTISQTHMSTEHIRPQSSNSTNIILTRNNQNSRLKRIFIIHTHSHTVHIHPPTPDHPYPFTQQLCANAFGYSNQHSHPAPLPPTYTTHNYGHFSVLGLSALCLVPHTTPFSPSPLSHTDKQIKTMACGGHTTRTLLFTNSPHTHTHTH